MPADLFHRYLAQDRRALSRLLTMAARGEAVGDIAAFLDRHPPATKPPIFAVTGSAGVGKSTLVGRLFARIRADGFTVAVLACDPQSPLTGGALLGDAFRMNAGDDVGVFIRSLATPGGTGGIAQHLDLLLRLLAGFGFDVLLVETVGAGQGDTTVHDLVDGVVLLVQPHAGDELQWEKAGLLEIADVVVVHKADLPGAEQTAAQLRSMLTLSPVDAPPIVLVSSASGTGFDDLWRELRARSTRDASASAVPTRP
jgi:LAO/AO transport system ATPase